MADVLFRAEVTRALCLPRVAFGRPLVDFGINDDNKLNMRYFWE